MHAQTLLSLEWHSGQNSRGRSGKAALPEVFVSEAATWQQPAKPLGDPLGLGTPPLPHAALLGCRQAGRQQPAMNSRFFALPPFMTRF